uniref:proline-rich protein HaeIII subfamily 1-like n=1 Tax=Nyctereutes procyonoides TaxID=34880 RepID=UPI002444EDF5|nr:proline-rich protein HaeIII subfamily 1-like [Nyctereutes procyonoides]
MDSKAAGTSGRLLQGAARQGGARPPLRAWARGPSRPAPRQGEQASPLRASLTPSQTRCRNRRPWGRERPEGDRVARSLPGRPGWGCGQFSPALFRGLCVSQAERQSLPGDSGALGVPPAGQGRLRELRGHSGPHKSAQASRGSGAESAVFKPWAQPSSNQGAPPLLPEPWQGSLARLTRAPGPRAQGPAAPRQPCCAEGPPQEWPRPASPQILEATGQKARGSGRESPLPGWPPRGPEQRARLGAERQGEPWNVGARPQAGVGARVTGACGGRGAAALRS